MQRFLSLEISAQDEAGQHEQSEQINSQNMEGRKYFAISASLPKGFFMLRLKLVSMKSMKKPPCNFHIYSKF